MSLIEQIDQDLKKALKGGNREAATTLRGLKSDIKYYQINNKLEKITDDDVVGVLSSAAKRRRDSIDQFKKGGREDLVAKETSELELIKNYLPEQMSTDDLEAIANEAIAEAGAVTPSDIGKVMKILMPKVKGKTDGKIVKETVTRLLTS